jgi:oligosaccharide repeat unit polymerase
MAMTLGSLLMVAGGVALVGPSVVFGLYEDWWAAKAAGADARFVDVGLIFATSGVFGLIASDDPRQPLRRYFALFIAALIAFLYVQKGARSPLIALCVGVGWCYSQRIKRIQPIMALAAAVVALMVLPMIKEFRHTKQISESSTLGPRKLMAQAFFEMGSSASVMGYTLDLIPATESYAYGITYLDAFLQAIPNLGITPGKSFVLYGLGKEYAHGTRISPSSWITEQLNPIWFDNGGGYGFAMVAEFYYNFGMPAVLIGMTGCGFLMARVRNASRRSDLWLVGSALLFAAMVAWVREVVGVPFKIATWPVIGLFLIGFAFRTFSRSSSRQRAALAHSALPSASNAGWSRED